MYQNIYELFYISKEVIIMLWLWSKQPSQQQSLSAWFVFLSTVIVYICSAMYVCVYVQYVYMYVYMQCGASVVDHFPDSVLSSDCFLLPQQRYTLQRYTVRYIKQIPNIKYVSAVVTKYVSVFFCCIGSYYFEICIFKYFSLHFTLKQDFTGNAMEYLE